MSLVIIDLILSLGISAYCTYLLCIYTAWYFFFAVIFMVPLCYYLIFGVNAVFLLLWSLFINRKKDVKKPDEFYNWVIRNVVIWLLTILRVKITYKGEEKLPPVPYLLIDNHVSDFDQMVLLAKIKDAPLICISKPENMDIPIAGPFIHQAGYIPINREDPRIALKAINKAVKFIKEDKADIAIAPEGTRNKTDKPLLPFHPGSFKIAYWAKCPLVLCCLKNTKEIKRRTPFRSTRVEMVIVKTLNYEDYKDLTSVELAKKAESMILQEYLK